MRLSEANEVVRRDDGDVTVMVGRHVRERDVPFSQSECSEFFLNRPHLPPSSPRSTHSLPYLNRLPGVVVHWHWASRHALLIARYAQIPTL